VEAPQFQRAKVQIPLVVVDLVQADILAAEDVTHVHPVMVPADPAVAADESDLEVPGIFQGWQPVGEAPERAAVARGGRLIAEGLMGPLVIELGPEVIEATLLRAEGPRRRAGGLALEGAMHPLMPPVLLRARHIAVALAPSPYTQQRRMAALFTAVLKAPVPPSLVADKILEIALGDTAQLRHPVGPDAAPFLAWRRAMSDEAWVALGALDDHAWYARIEADFGLDARAQAQM
jgi:hypothetical protein